MPLDFSDPSLLLNLGAGLIAGSKFGSNAGEGLLQGLQSYREGQASQAQQQAAQQESQLRQFQIAQAQRQQDYQQALGQQFAGKNPQGSAVQAAAAAPAGPGAPPPTAPMPQGAAAPPSAPPPGGPPAAPVPGAPQQSAPQSQAQAGVNAYTPWTSDRLAQLPLPPTIKDQGDGTAIVQGADGNYSRVPVTQIRDQQKQVVAQQPQVQAALNASSELASSTQPKGVLAANPNLNSAWVGFATAHGANPSDVSSVAGRQLIQQFAVTTHNNLAGSLGLGTIKADGNWVDKGAGVQVNTATGESKVTDSSAHDEAINASLAGTPAGKVVAAAAAAGYDLPDGGRGFQGKADVARAMVAANPNATPEQIVNAARNGSLDMKGLQETVTQNAKTMAGTQASVATIDKTLDRLQALPGALNPTGVPVFNSAINDLRNGVAPSAKTAEAGQYLETLSGELAKVRSGNFGQGGVTEGEMAAARRDVSRLATTPAGLQGLATSLRNEGQDRLSSLSAVGTGAVAGGTSRGAPPAPPKPSLTAGQNAAVSFYLNK